MPVVGRQWLTLNADFGDSRHCREQRLERSRAAHDATTALLANEHDIARELHSIAEALLGIDEQRLASECRAVPERTGEAVAVAAELRQREPSFVLPPALVELAVEQECQRKIPVG